MRPFLKISILSLGCFSTNLKATTSVSFSGANVRGSEAYEGLIRTVELAHEENYLNPGEIGWLTGVSLSHSSDPSSEGQSVSLDQGIGSGMAFGASASQTNGLSQGGEAKSYKNTRYALRSSIWIRENTLRLGLDASSQKTNKEAREYLDVDGVNIQTMPLVTGKTITFKITHLTTPTTISMANISQTTTSGRPSAHSAGVELRQFINLFKASVHGAFDMYEDSEDVEKTTDYGRVLAQSQTLRYYQRLKGDLIVSSVSRWHQETETPRPTANPKIEKYNTLSDNFTETIGIRWRYVKGSWTDDASEIGLYGSMFTKTQTINETVDKQTVRSIGMQLKVVI